MKNTKLLIWPLLSLILLGCNKPLPVAVTLQYLKAVRPKQQQKSQRKVVMIVSPSSSEIDTPITDRLFPYSYQSDTFPAAPLKDFLSDFNVSVTIPSADVLKQHYYRPTIRSENYGTYF